MKATEPLPALSPDEQEAYEERAALMQYDSGLSRQDAERKAAENRKSMPHIACVVDAITAHFGPVRVTYACENGRELGRVSAVSTRPVSGDVPAVHTEEGRQ